MCIIQKYLGKFQHKIYMKIHGIDKLVKQENDF